MSVKTKVPATTKHTLTPLLPSHILTPFREVTTEVFLAASSVQSERSALFVGWALLVSYDLFLNADDETLSFDIPCDDGHETVDVWCPEGSGSEDIEFFRSQVCCRRLVSVKRTGRGGQEIEIAAE